MSIESLTYADLAGRLGTSREAARSLVRRLRLPRVTADDGTVRFNVDLSEIQYQPLSSRPRVVTGRTSKLSKRGLSSYRPRSSSVKPRKAPLKPLQPDTERISSLSANAATS